MEERMETEIRFSNAGDAGRYIAEAQAENPDLMFWVSQREDAERGMFWSVEVVVNR